MTVTIPDYPEMRCAVLHDPVLELPDGEQADLSRNTAVGADTLIGGTHARAVVLVADALVGDGEDPVDLARPLLAQALEDFRASAAP